jgi:hypothetical protein
MRRAYYSGLAAALHCWPIVLVLFLASFTSALAFGAAAWSWLSLALDNSLATRSLLSNLSAQVFIDLFIHHRESFLMLLASGVVMAAGFVLLGAWLNAIAVAAVTAAGSFSACVVRAFRTYPTYLGLTAVVSLLHLAAIGASLLLDRGLMRWAAESASEMTPYWIAALSTTFGGLGVLFFATVHDHARIRATSTDAGVWRALGWAFAFVIERERRALPLAAALLASSVLPWLVYQSIASLIPTHSAFGVTLSLLWGQVLLLVRMFVRVWWLAAETQLQRATEPAGYWAHTDTA